MGPGSTRLRSPAGTVRPGTRVVVSTTERFWILGRAALSPNLIRLNSLLTPPPGATSTWIWFPPPAAGAGAVVPACRPVTGRVVTGAAVTGTPSAPATAIRDTSSGGPMTTAPWNPAAAAGFFGSALGSTGASSLTTV